MIALVVLCIIAAVIAVVLLLPVGADIAYEGGQLRVKAKISGYTLQILPKAEAKGGKKPKKKKKSKAEQTNSQPAQKEAKPKKKLGLNFNAEELFSLVKAAVKGIGKFGKKLKVDRFLLIYVAAGKDPYNTAMNFAYVNSALSALAPMCAERFSVKDCRVYTDVDFMAEKTVFEFGLALTIRIGQILAVVFTIVFAALGILIRNRRRLKKESKEQMRAALTQQSAANEEIKQDNTEAEERKAANG